VEPYVCVHGHFYQPPRENPWLEAIELQDSAYPYHDWNERIAAECYAPNTVSRILDGDGRIVKIVNNYARISFNFGPTLLTWLEEKAPDVYEAVLEADRESRERFSGHGSAVAQGYSHVIMPLANRRDRQTQVLWGIGDFQRRFGRRPEGMWLPETAVDLETLDVMAEQGIRFTILAPHQASRVRKMGEGDWLDVSGGRIYSTKPYLLRLPSGGEINIFFYDGPLSHAISFEGLLNSGDELAKRLVGRFVERYDDPQIIHVASDGESYGHHHRHGDMALAYALHHIESNNLARLTNYGEYLERFPPDHEVEIFENTSWSCPHGVERWRSDCGCNSGGRPGWKQSWRAPLREALDWLRDNLGPLYEERAGELLKDPWSARDNYVDVILDRSPENVRRFFAEQATRQLNEAETTSALKLLELQRCAMLMYTSCGWFFDDLSGVETVQVIQFAGRAIQLAGELFGKDIEGPFLQLLERAKSNIPAQGDGRAVYENFVKPAMVDLRDVCAHYGVSSLFDSYGEQDKIHCYTVEREDYQEVEAGAARLAVGKARVTSEITGDSASLSFGVVHFGDHNVNGGVRSFRGQGEYKVMVKEVTDAFKQGDLPAVIRLLDSHFLELTYSLRSLFRDEQRKILNLILESTLAEAEAAYRQVYERHALLMRFLADLGVPLPKAFRTAAEIVLNVDLRRAFQADEPDSERIRSLLEEAATRQAEIDAPGLAYLFNRIVERLADKMVGEPTSLDPLLEMAAALDLARYLPFEVDLWRAQNVYYEMAQTAYPQLRDDAAAGDEAAAVWVQHFIALAEGLSVCVE